MLLQHRCQAQRLQRSCPSSRPPTSGARWRAPCMSATRWPPGGSTAPRLPLRQAALKQQPQRTLSERDWRQLPGCGAWSVEVSGWPQSAVGAGRWVLWHPRQQPLLLLPLQPSTCGAVVTTSARQAAWEQLSRAAAPSRPFARHTGRPPHSHPPPPPACSYRLSPVKPLTN